MKINYFKMYLSDCFKCIKETVGIIESFIHKFIAALIDIYFLKKLLVWMTSHYQNK